VTAVGLAVAVEVTFTATDVHSVWLAILAGAAVWLAFSATTLLQHNAFELKPPGLTIINSAYQLHAVPRDGSRDRAVPVSRRADYRRRIRSTKRCGLC